ncbi:hypothetical protein P3TCK_18312 [Photobacterium profundum 3TCK]|uniref:Uncharacterized protein n=1 Tax=Photobacterium profundum 3TCK TaxID=314280 RepID=Q1Z506_9GAMM|nr:hypothetical protein P3TCK_18312 [Photobacterium profundum 3TCK]
MDLVLFVTSNEAALMIPLGIKTNLDKYLIILAGLNWL